jgi:hypothetical protein
MFRRVTSATVSGVVAGNYDHASADTLRDAANDTLDELERNAAADARSRYEAARGNNLALADENQLQAAARAGRIELLLVKAASTHDNMPANSDTAGSISNRVCIATLRHGGDVRLMPATMFPEDSGHIAAVLRY